MVTAGRTGSTLLAAIMGDAGANFAVPVPDDWNTARGGPMALSEVRKAAYYLRLAYDLAPRKPPVPPARWVWGWLRSQGKRSLKRALGKAVYVKGNDLDLAVPYSIKLGYFPRVIVSYRRFGSHALSYSQMLVNFSVESMVTDYDRIYRNAVLQLQAYGGCAVSYNDLIDRTRTDWAKNLADVTGLPADAILASRARRLKSVAREETSIPVSYASVEQSFAAVDALAGRAWPPSRQALRNWAPGEEARPTIESQPSPSMQRARG